MVWKGSYGLHFTSLEPNDKSMGGCWIQDYDAREAVHGYF